MNRARIGLGTSLCACMLATACVGKIIDAEAVSGPGGPSAGVPPPSLPGPLLPATFFARRLTSTEYDNTLRDLLGDPSANADQSLPPSTLTPFDNDATQQVPSEALIEGAESLADDAATWLLANPAVRDQIVGCKPTGPGDSACFQQFIASFGRLALRRSLPPDEVSRYLGFLPFATDGGDFYIAVEMAIRALLQDPRFLYRIEIGIPDAGLPGTLSLDGPEVAARLSYLILGSTPDGWLLDLAESGELATGDQVRAAATRALADPRAAEQIARFHAMWLGYSAIPLDPTLAAAMRAESDALVRRVVVTDQLPWDNLLTFDQTFVPSSLATLYGLPTSDAGTPVWTSYAGTGRLGILSQGGFLSNGIKFGDSSPTQRGLAVRTRLLCETIPPPPPGVVTDQPVPAVGGDACKVARYQAHAVGGCASCHDLMDPVGFGLENYDPRGAYRTHDEGLPACAVSGQGTLAGVGDGGFDGPGELGALLASSPRFHECAAIQLYRFAMGRTDLDATDQQSVAGLTQRLTGPEPRFEDLMLDFASSDAFRVVQAQGN